MKMTLAAINENDSRRDSARAGNGVHPDAQLHQLIRTEKGFTIAERWMFGLVFAAVLASFVQQVHVAESLANRLSKLSLGHRAAPSVSAVGMKVMHESRLPEWRN